jgi:anti-anti-sigma factor
MSNGVVVLEAIAGRTPEPRDIEQVIESLVRNHTVGRVIVDLSALNLVTSSFIARLVAMNKLIRSAGGEHCLCGLRPVVREILERVRVDKAFEIVASEDEPLEDV